MVYIQHRVNKISDLILLDHKLGSEIDLRSDLHRPSYIHLAHNPWTQGDSLQDWLYHYSKLKMKNPIIFNTKEDGLEEEVFRLTSFFNISNFFFLDTAFPTLIRYLETEKSQHFSCRISKYESIESLKPFKGQISWVWVDCLNGHSFPQESLKAISNDFKLCLVSPELVKMPTEAILDFKYLKNTVHSICTKRPDLWE